MPTVHSLGPSSFSYSVVGTPRRGWTILCAVALALLSLCLPGWLLSYAECHFVGFRCYTYVETPSHNPGVFLSRYNGTFSGIFSFSGRLAIGTQASWNKARIFSGGRLPNCSKRCGVTVCFTNDRLPTSGATGVGGVTIGAVHIGDPTCSITVRRILLPYWLLTSMAAVPLTPSVLGSVQRRVRRLLGR